ncbi:uncharacterized protein LOC129942553 [Eupeodes corollae]|uniref:uncharacterized protein LOC129942553 n=1 Tax=Eupeodes corollae TaxID=290404 RepID=UPI00249345A7|nr:uncharacterized protein LOC129942553 [Eupeodes corollae]
MKFFVFMIFGFVVTFVSVITAENDFEIRFSFSKLSNQLAEVNSLKLQHRLKRTLFSKNINFSSSRKIPIFQRILNNHRFPVQKYLHKKYHNEKMLQINTNWNLNRQNGEKHQPAPQAPCSKILKTTVRQPLLTSTTLPTTIKSNFATMMNPLIYDIDIR